MDPDKLPRACSFGMHLVGDKSEPVIFCSMCSEEIVDAKDGLYWHRLWDIEGNPVEIYFMHTWCSHLIPCEASWGSGSITSLFEHIIQRLSGFSQEEIDANPELRWEWSPEDKT